MIELLHITKRYDTLVFEDLNIQIPKRGLTFIYGKSGCGKSTLLNMIAGFDQDYEGDIIVDGQPYTTEEESRKIRYQEIAYMNQKDDLIQEMTVQDHIKWFHSITHSDFDIQLFLDKFHLNDIKNHYPNQLSGGELSLISLLKNILLNRPYILLDEPTAKLDEHRKEILKELIVSLTKDYSIVVVSHDLDFIDLADTIFHFEHKKLIIQRQSEIIDKQYQETHSKSLPLFQLNLSNFKFYKVRYILSALAMMLLICYGYVFFNMGQTLFPQIKSIINENGELDHIQATSENITYDMIQKVEKESFIERVDYSFQILYPSLYKDDTVIKIDNQKYSFDQYPVRYHYDVHDSLQDNDIIISQALASDLDIKIGNQIELYVYCRTGSKWNPDNEFYTPELKPVHYLANIKNIVDDGYLIQISNSKVHQIIEEEIGFDNSILKTNHIELYLRSGIQYSDVKETMLSQYGMECTDLIGMAQELLDFNRSTYDILRVYGVICSIIGVIFIVTSLLVYHRYETRQRRTLDLIGIEQKRILRMQFVQNLIPLILAFIASQVILSITTPLLNQYFFEKKLFYEPFMSLSQFIQYDFSKVQILEFHFMLIILMTLFIAIIITLYKYVLFQFLKEKKD